LVSMMMSISFAASAPSTLERAVAAFPVVIWPNMMVAEMPIPCCPRDWRTAWKREPYNRRPKTLGMDVDTIPGPLSSIMTRYSFWSTLSMLTMMSGRIWASSQASRELSTPSLMPMIRDFTGESKPRI